MRNHRQRRLDAGYRTINEVAREIGVSKYTLTSAVRRGNVMSPSHRWGPVRTFYHVDEIEELRDCLVVPDGPLTIRDVERRLGLVRNTVRNHVVLGWLKPPTHEHRGQWYYEESELDWIERYFSKREKYEKNYRSPNGERRRRRTLDEAREEYYRRDEA